MKIVSFAAVIRVTQPCVTLITAAKETTTETATKKSLKKGIRASSNIIALIPSRSIRQMLAIFSGVEF